MPGPFIVLPLQVKAPDIFLLVQIERQQAVESCRCQEYRVLHTADFVTVLEVTVLEGFLNLETLVVTKEFDAGSDVAIIIGKCAAAQSAVGTPAFKVDLSRVPVDVLFTFLLLEINSEYTAVAITLLAAPYNGSRD